MPPANGGGHTEGDQMKQALAKHVELAETAIHSIASLGFCDAIKCFGLRRVGESPPNFYER